MVLLHALENGRTPGRYSTDLDVVADVRARPGHARRIATCLTKMGFAAGSSNTDGIAQRFTRGAVDVDVHVPDNLGPRANIVTVPPSATVPIPGATFALKRAEPVRVVNGSREGVIHRPDLLGALVVKSRAACRDRSPERHLLDLAFLYSLVGDLPSLRAELGAKDRSRLREVTPLSVRDAPPWAAIADRDHRRAGQAAFAYLSRC